ncbi:MAG: isoprenylcysteine carboxylmethyltransferase family protein [Planctomycetota bacterium]|nr:MAG: isoprenylcysteine carboxylmethyltransferase family protein [Planctomycetota bacterium]
MESEPPNARVSESSLQRSLRRIPLPLRVGFYYLVFLTLILWIVPSLAHAAGLRWLPWRPDFGAARPFGWLLFGVCFVLYTASSIVLTSRGRGAYVEFDPPTEFVASGPYRWCRNPIAACVLGMLLGLGIAFSSAGILVFFALGLALAHAQVVLLEEPLLRRRFGRRYEEYCRRVPRWLPRPPRDAA